MPKRVLCKFFAHGACLKGEHCDYLHDWTASPNNVCTFYQKGACSYGSRCRYDHVKPSRPWSASSSSSNQIPCSSSPVFPDDVPHPATNSPDLVQLQSTWPSINQLKPVWNQTPARHEFVSDDDPSQPIPVHPADRAICSFASAGSCPRGGDCPHIHGDLCPTCGKHCLHPFRPEERAEHAATCERKQKQLESLKLSQEIECSVCLDRVLSKPAAAERKFGILSECDHPFCITCIRNWRNSSPTTGMDVNSSLRACPICRKLSYFVVPSVIWYASKEEKKEITDNYMAKLKSIDCKHFNFGNGNCPFGTSCFYKMKMDRKRIIPLMQTVFVVFQHWVRPGSYTWKYHRMPNHAYRDGRLEEVVLRHLGAEDGQTVIAKDIRLSDFLGDLRIS